MQQIRLILRVAVTGLALATGAVPAAADPLVVAPANPRTNVFAGREATLGTVIRGGDAVAGKLVWVLAVADRTLATGVADIRHPGAGETRADVTVAIPEGRAGVVVDAEFAAALVDAAGTRLGACTRRVRIFPVDPFADRRQWLESLGIVLIDPSGATEKVLAAAGVPFTSVRADIDVTALRAPVIIVGEGTSWTEHPRLPRDLAVVAAGGAGVLCLAPRDGTMPLPGNADEPGTLVTTSLRLRRADVVADLDARLDCRDWSATGETVRSRLTIDVDGAAAVVRAGDGPTGWPWLEAGFARRETDPPAGTIVVCGFGVVAHWDETPAARYLLAALLERLTTKQPVAAAGPPRVDPPRAELPNEPPKENER